MRFAWRVAGWRAAGWKVAGWWTTRQTRMCLVVCGADMAVEFEMDCAMDAEQRGAPA